MQTVPTNTSVMEYIKNTIAENFGGPSHKLVKEENFFELEQVPDLSGKVAVVTGGTEGIGFGAAHTLLSKNISKLFVASIRKEVADEAIKAITEDLGEEKAKRFIWMQCDLADWEQTSKVASEIARKTDRIDILINVAARGIMTRQLDANGVDLHMSINHFGHVVFTSHLLPTIKKTAKDGNTVRIVNFASNIHESTPSETEFSSLEEINRDYGPNGQYGRSKLATLLHAKWLHKHLSSEYPNILVNAIHPGIVDTAQTNDHIHEAYPVLGYGMSLGMKPFRKDQFQGCVSAMYAATTTDKGGQYIAPPCVVEKGSDKANDMALADRLMKLTAEIIEQKTRKESSAKGCPFDEA